MTLTSFGFQPGDLRGAFPPQYLERARRYLQQGRVLTADYNGVQGQATGRVRGSGGRVYQCLVHLGHEPDGSAMVVGQCSCPVGYNCKHVAAVLLKLGEEGSKPEASISAALPLEVRNWLRRAERLAADLSREDPHRLLFLVRREERSGLQRTLVRAAKVRALADGGYGKAQDFNISGQSQARFLTAEDHRILALVQASHGPSIADGEAVLADAAGTDVLQAIASTGRGHWRDQDGPVLRWDGIRAGRLEWRLGEDARLRVVLEADSPGLDLLPLAPPCYLDPETGACGPLDTGLGEREAGLLAAAPVLTPETAAALAETAPQTLRGLDLPLPPRPKRRRAKADRPVPCLRLLSEDLMADLRRHHWNNGLEPDWSDTAALCFDYGGIPVDPRDESRVLLRVEDGGLVESERNLEAEAAAVQALEAFGFERTPDLGEGAELRFELPDEDPAWLWFMETQAPRLKAEGWRIEIEPGFRFRVARLGDWQLEIAESEGGHWLDLGLGVEVDGERLDLLPLLVDLLQRFDLDLSPRTLAQLDDEATLPVRLDDGRLLPMPAGRLRPILSTLVELYDPQALQRDGSLRLARTQAAELAELERADRQLTWSGGDAVRQWGRRLKDFAGIDKISPPAGLKAELRPYQQQGIEWLQFLREYELGGVLADDMGLGKTVQTLTHLLLEKESGRADRPSLVVAPTSLMFNWRREAERFAPALRVLVLHGPSRRKDFDALDEQDLVLTTYPLLPRDLDVLAAQQFHLLILDEAQAVKNPRAKAAQAVRAIDARHRLCLTGTPMENHLGELWSLLDFLMPGLLGDERRFKRLFRTPIERYGDDARQDQLRRRVAPFLLRRTKEEVATELPPKTEILREVPLAGDQRDLYETLRLALHEKVRKEVERKGLARSGIIILDALLKLRQACCDPRLVALESARKVKGSAKLDLLMTLLPELLEEGRRILLFSQFTSMLDLIEAELMQMGMRQNDGFVKLTGRTRNRDLPVDRFQSGEVPLFLISLKAGGSGLNLTAADTVIHYDPWWNPAAERQATDRAHRIGQDKPVFVYKLLTEGTVEQKVAELQARKQALADAMLAGGGAAAGSLSAEDLELLFAPVT
ncbi:MAG: SNF2-related protein [Pseudomonadota bacterium]|nr:SNF2-related protein [Pseudomonadota bacterium]